MTDYILQLMPSLLEGLKTTLLLFVVTLLLSVPLGILVAVLRLSKWKILSKLMGAYILIMRGTPLLLQLIFIFFGLPLVGITFDRFPAAILAFALNYAAYFAEIFRAGIQDIDKGQFEAAEVLGLSPRRTFFRIVLPQVIKKVLPPISNEVITLIKDTALVYVLGLDEMLRAAKIAVNTDSTLVPFVVVGIIYILLTAFFTEVFKRLEGRYSYYE